MKLTVFALNLILSFSALAGWSEIEFSNSELTTKIHLRLPQNYDPAKKHALMINLHGCAQKATTLKEAGNWDEASDEYNTIIAIPEVPNGGVIFGCWDYYGLDHSRVEGLSGYLISLTKHLSNSYAVDNDRVGISGLSSGAGMSLVMGCIAPDIYSLVGSNAGPSVGTGSNDISRARITIEEILSNCNKLNSKLVEAHSQIDIVSIIYGSNDYLVDTKYNTKNAEAFAARVEAEDKRTSDLSHLEGTNLSGELTEYFHAGKLRVSLIQNTGLGHNWPAGSTEKSGGFINKRSINYPKYLLHLLTKEL